MATYGSLEHADDRVASLLDALDETLDRSFGVTAGRNPRAGHVFVPTSNGVLPTVEPPGDDPD